MTSEERVLAAFRFTPPDRIPVFDQFWTFPPAWRERFGDPAGLTDVARFVPDETPFPSRARTLKEEGDSTYRIDGWGRTSRVRAGSYFEETLDVALPEGTEIDRLRFEPIGRDARYYGERTREEFDAWVRSERERHYLCVKTGGPFLRTTFLRGETRFLMDMAADPVLARSIADRVADHIAAVGVEALRRASLHGTGIWIYDDMADNRGPLFSPRTFEKVLLPAYRRMVGAYRDAGARHVLLHSDGNILPILDMLVDAGIEGLNPLERRAGMEMEKVRVRYPSLILTGGMCNTRTLVEGPAGSIEAEARSIIDLGRNGGVVIGTHSIGAEVPLAHYEAYRNVCLTYGDFSAGGSPSGP